MHDIPALDPGRHIDWSLTSADYAAHRPGPPARLYDMLALLGVGGPGQRLLDLGTGTGLVAREFARRGCAVSGTDIAPGQIDAARGQALAEGLVIDFQVAPAEACPHADASFDIVTASQCWMYFDPDRAIAEVRRVLKPGGFAGHHAFQLAGASRRDCPGQRRTGVEVQPGVERGPLVGRRALGPAVVGRPRGRAGDVLVRRSRAVHARQLARAHACLLRGGRHLVARRGGCL